MNEKITKRLIIVFNSNYENFEDFCSLHTS